MDNFLRSRMLLGDEALHTLANSKVLVFGVGGVGGYVCEGLVRCGLGHLTIVDNDVVNESNINRQIIALTDTIGKDKVELIKQRALKINPDIEVECKKIFFLKDTPFDFTGYDYVVDAIDTVTGKLEIISRAKQANIPVISCMGTGNKLDPSQLKIDDIKNTSVCPLARVMRRELKNRNISGVEVLYSTEKAKIPTQYTDEIVVSSVVFVPATAGLKIAAHVVNKLITK